jgi:serine/threonine protein kinase/tetratricopeptide (TPR) repeat protein
MQDLKGQQIGQFELLERLGRGGMAEVYRAYQPSMDRFVAIKIMLGHLAEESEDFIERFKREAQEVGKLRHPHIVNVFDFGVQDDLYFMVMEYIQGGTLKAHIKRKNGLPPREALTIASQIADALQYAHKARMVHRDLKPANIMFIDDSNNHAVLTDFGIARILGKTELTASGAMVGTPAYMSPEVGRGKSLDHRADLYGLGVILYEMLAGRVPYDADTPLAVIMQHANAPLPTRQDFGWDIPESLERLILHAMAKEPDNRFQSATEMRAAIEDTLVSLPGNFVAQPRFSDRAEVPTNRYEAATELDAFPHEDEQPTTVPPQRTPRVKPRHERQQRPLRLPLAVASLVMVAVVAVAAVLLLTGGSDDPDPLPTPAPELGLAHTEVPTGADSPDLRAEEAPEIAEGIAPPSVEATNLSGFNPVHDEIEQLILADEQSEAFTFLDNLLADDPENVEALAARSTLLRSIGDYDSAQADALAVIDRSPDDPLGYYMLNDALRAMGGEESLDAAWTAMALSGDDPQAVWRLAATANDLGDEALYQEMLARSLAENPAGLEFLVFASDALYFDQRYEDALPYLRAWYESGYQQSYARVLLGGALIQANQLDDALTLARNTEKLNAADFSETAYMAYRAGEFDLAREWAQSALALEPDYQQAQYTLGLVSWYADSDLEAADSYIAPLVGESYSGDPYLITNFGHFPSLDLARIHAQAEDLNTAADYYQMTVDSNPTIYEIWAEYGEIRLSLDEPDQAAELFRTAYQVMIDSGEYFLDNRNYLMQHLVNLHFGDAAADVSNPPAPDSLPEALIAVPLSSGDHPLLHDVEQLIIAENGFAAVDRVTAEIEANPTSADLYAIRVWAWLSVDEAELALQDADTAISLDPENILGYLARADVMMHWSNSDAVSARAAVEEAAARQPDNPEVVWRMAWLDWWENDIEAAIDGFIRAHDLGAQGWRYANIAGIFWYDAGDFERALPLLQTDLYARRDLYDGARVFGSFIQLGREPEGFDLAQQLTFLADQWTPDYHVLAYAAYRAGDFQQAKAWAQVVLSQEPDFPTAQYVYGLVLWRGDGNLNEAIATFESLRETDYQSPLINTTFGHHADWELARIYTESGDLESALAAYEDTLNSLGEASFILAERADVNIALGDIDAAREDLRRAYETSQNPEEREALLQRLTELGE